MLRLNERFSNCYELLVRASHGQTLGYTRTPDGSLVPNLEENEGDAIEAYGYEDYVNGVNSFTRARLKQGKSKILTPQDFSLLLEYCNYLTSDEIDMDTLDLLGGIPFTLDGKVNHITCYSPRLDEEQARHYVETGKLPHYWGPRLLWSRKRSIGEAAEILTQKTNVQARIKTQEANIEKLREEKLAAEKKVADIKKSNSFKIGRVATFIPRKVRKTVRVLRRCKKK